MQAIAEDPTDIQVAKYEKWFASCSKYFYINLRQNYCATGRGHRFLRIGSRYYDLKKGCKNVNPSEPTCRGNRTIIKTTRKKSNK